MIIPTTKLIEKSKKHFCMFCQKLQTKFARHLQLVHKNEGAVKKFNCLPKNDKLRKQLIDEIRKKGDFMFNTDKQFNKAILIVPRQRQKNSKNQAADFVCCKFCCGFYPKNTLRSHVKNCPGSSHKKGTRDLLKNGRAKTGFVHHSAVDVLREKVLPVLNDDEISRNLLYDELIILYANEQCFRHNEIQYDMIRANIRLLSRLVMELKKNSEDIRELKDAIAPKHLDVLVCCIRSVAKWDPTTQFFKTPSVATNLTALIKKCAYRLMAQSIKTQNDDKKKSIKDFLVLWETEIPIFINKKACEDQSKIKRSARTILPCKEDIKKLFDYVRNNSEKALHGLKDKFDLNAWNSLIQSTLIALQIFNRRRAGEIERLTIENYNTGHAIEENMDRENFASLSKESQEIANKYTRLTIRGKLNRTVPVLLTPFDKFCIDTILKYRKKAGVKETNIYIFSVAHCKPLAKPYVRACPILKMFAERCGARCPMALRGTMLRKHLATYTSLLNVEDMQIDRLANFMGHHKDIHKSIYRIPVSVAEITEVSKMLMAALGNDDPEDESIPVPLTNSE